MRLSYRSTMYLSVQDTKEIIKDYLKNKFDSDIKEISFDVVKEIHSYGSNEHEAIEFKGVKITTADFNEKVESVEDFEVADQKWISPFREGNRYEEV